MSQGKVWLVGTGPGDPELLTLRARSVLEQAEVVIYDALVGQGILAMIPPRPAASTRASTRATTPSPSTR